MDFKFFYKSLLKIIFIPGRAWDSVIMENRSVKNLRNSFLYPFVILITLAAFLGSIIFSNSNLNPVYSVFTGFRYLILFLSLPFASAIILSEITKPLDLGKNYAVSFRLIVYSLTPFFLCQIVSLLFESLVFVNVLSLYGLFIFWSGAEKMLSPPDYKKMPLLIATFITVTGLYFTGNIVLTSVIERIYYSFFA